MVEYKRQHYVPKFYLRGFSKMAIAFTYITLKNRKYLKLRYLIAVKKNTFIVMIQSLSKF